MKIALSSITLKFITGIFLFPMMIMAGCSEKKNDGFYRIDYPFVDLKVVVPNVVNMEETLLAKDGAAKTTIDSSGERKSELENFPDSKMDKIVKNAKQAYIKFYPAEEPNHIAYLYIVKPDTALTFKGSDGIPVILKDQYFSKLPFKHKVTEVNKDGINFMDYSFFTGGNEGHYYVGTVNNYWLIFEFIGSDSNMDKYLKEIWEKSSFNKGKGTISKDSSGKKSI